MCVREGANIVCVREGANIMPHLSAYGVTTQDVHKCSYELCRSYRKPQSATRMLHAKEEYGRTPHHTA